MPSVHVLWATLIAVFVIGSSSSRWRWWILADPILTTLVVVATGNHYFTDVFLGALTAGFSALLAKQLLARARPDAWAFGEVAA